jgi:TatD DNase family protein
LSPEPVRKIRRNEPAHLRHIAARIAAVRNVDMETLARSTTKNARRFFRLAD